MSPGPLASIGRLTRGLAAAAGLVALPGCSFQTRYLLINAGAVALTIDTVVAGTVSYGLDCVPTVGPAKRGELTAFNRLPAPNTGPGVAYRVVVPPGHGVVLCSETNTTWVTPPLAQLTVRDPAGAPLAALRGAGIAAVFDDEGRWTWR